MGDVEFDPTTMKCPSCGAPHYDLDYEYDLIEENKINWSCWECGHEWTAPKKVDS